MDYKTSKKASSLNELKKDMQLLVYALAVKEMYGDGPLKVGNWFLRSNEKVFFEPENQAIESNANRNRGYGIKNQSSSI